MRVLSCSETRLGVGEGLASSSRAGMDRCVRYYEARVRVMGSRRGLGASMDAWWLAAGGGGDGDAVFGCSLPGSSGGSGFRCFGNGCFGEGRGGRGVRSGGCWCLVARMERLEIQSVVVVMVSEMGAGYWWLEGIGVSGDGARRDG